MSLDVLAVMSGNAEVFGSLGMRVLEFFFSHSLDNTLPHCRAQQLT